MHRQGADCAFAEIFAFDAECVVVASAVILPSDPRRELHQLRLVEMLAQTIEKGVGNFDRSPCHRVGILQDEALQLRKVGIGAVVWQIRNLLGSDAMRSADGRADVNSKRASDQSCDAEFRQSLQPRIYELAAGLRLLHLTVSP